MVGESFHPRGCWGEDSDHIRLGATAQKLSRLFAFLVRVSSYYFVDRFWFNAKDYPRKDTKQHEGGLKKLDFSFSVGYLLPAK